MFSVYFSKPTKGRGLSVKITACYRGKITDLSSKSEKEKTRKKEKREMCPLYIHIFEYVSESCKNLPVIKFVCGETWLVVDLYWYVFSILDETNENPVLRMGHSACLKIYHENVLKGKQPHESHKEIKMAQIWRSINKATATSDIGNTRQVIDHYTYYINGIIQKMCHIERVFWVLKKI